MSVQIVEIAGQKIAMLPIADYQRLLDIAEDKADAFAAAQAEQRRIEGEEYLPSEMVDRILTGDHPLRVWRDYRSMTLAQLAGMIGARQATLSEIENGKAQGKPALWRALADALRVSVDDILPDA
jgi:DNA-binding XRE family transcriptional regulator